MEQLAMSTSDWRVLTEDEFISFSWKSAVTTLFVGFYKEKVQGNVPYTFPNIIVLLMHILAKKLSYFAHPISISFLNSLTPHQSAVNK